MELCLQTGYVPKVQIFVASSQFAGMHLGWTHTGSRAQPRVMEGYLGFVPDETADAAPEDEEEYDDWQVWSPSRVFVAACMLMACPVELIEISSCSDVTKQYCVAHSCPFHHREARKENMVLC